MGDLVRELRYSMSSRPNRSLRFLKTSGQYSLILKWLGRFSLLKAWLSIFTLEKARKSSGMSITGMLTCCNSWQQQKGTCSWKVTLLLPLQCDWFPTWKPRGEGHWNGKVFFWGVSPEEIMSNNEKRIAEKKCFTLNRLVFILAMELSISTPPEALSHFLLFSSQHYFFLSSLSEPSVILKREWDYSNFRKENCELLFIYTKCVLSVLSNWATGDMGVQVEVSSWSEELRLEFSAFDAHFLLSLGTRYPLSAKLIKICELTNRNSKFDKNRELKSYETCICNSNWWWPNLLITDTRYLLAVCMYADRMDIFVWI